ncbi:metallophosphoesterase [Thioclava sp. SK-1]|uniref:metallophosphoesterase n=1 Tax=Thioclava sp. SK-1 TaxID=1889770 RepID=UPI002100ABD3|nr:metallophosphoesterase [Thioclava sp. SK-1]
MTGDVIDGTLDAREADVAPLAGLRATDGVFVVSGNHEYYFDHDRWMAHYAGLGMIVLHNEHVVLGTRDNGLIVAGVPDRSAHRFGLPGPDLGSALQGAPEGLPVILLNHQPADALLSAGAGVALHLAGHTHGGMIRGLDALIARFNDGFVSGLYRLGNTTLYVNNGTALWPGFAIRLGVPAELSVFILQRA